MNKSAEDLANKAMTAMTLSSISLEIEESTLLINSYLRMMSDAISEVSTNDSESVLLFIERVFALSRAQETQMGRFDGMADEIYALSRESKSKVADEAALPA